MPDQNPYGGSVTPPAPTLGYGTTGEAPINAVNQWMRSQPWYQQLLTSWGQRPDNVHLSDYQKQAIIRAAQAHGVVVDEGGNGQEIDDSGNFQAKGHKLRNTLIVAGIAGAALLTAGAAGAFAGAGGVTAAGAPLASTTISPIGALATGAAASSAVPTALAAGAGTVGAAGAGATIAGTVAPAIAPAAAKATSSWLAPVIGGTIGAVGNVVGSKIQSDANTEAAKIQADSVQKALDFEKQQYADLQGRLAPYVSNGQTSSDRMAQLLGLPARSGTSATAPPTYGPSVGPNDPAASKPAITAQPVARDAAQPAAEPLVTIQAPDGTTRTLPKSQADYFISKGAKPVGAAA